MTSFGTLVRRLPGCRPTLDRAADGLLGGPSQSPAGRMGLAAIEELTRILCAAAGEEKSVVQHGVPWPPSWTSSVDDVVIQALDFHFVNTHFHFS
jgi:hypothetical protein